MTETLSEKTARVGLRIVRKAHPEWGTWAMRRDRTGWIISGDSGTQILAEIEFHFWVIVR